MKNSKFQIKNFKISDIKHCIKHQTTKDDNQSVRANGKTKKTGFISQISQIWPTNFIYQFYCLYSTNIILFQKAYVSSFVTDATVPCSPFQKIKTEFQFFFLF